MSSANISTKQLSEQLENPETIVLDIRPSAAYNGWKLQGEARGGHIPGAVNIPLAWAEDLSIPGLAALFLSKGIAKNAPIVIYGYQAANCALMAGLLSEFGCRNILIYEPGASQWAADANLPMDRLARYEQLVHPDWIAALISNERSMHSPDGKYGLFEVNWEGFQEYQRGHIPGAAYLDLGSLEGPPSWNRYSDDQLLACMLAQGITCDSTIILYGRVAMAAARAACILMYAGVEDVRILDGGFDAWLKAGKAVETDVHQPPPVEAFGKRVPGHPEYFICIEEVKTLLTDDHSVLVSVTSWDEYTGKTNGYDYIKPRGRISGAVWGHSGLDPKSMQDYCNIDQTWRSYHEISSFLAAAGIHPKKRVAFYCGTGWRASEAFICAYLMGWPNIAVYDGGWYEWSQNETNPIEVGAPKRTK